MSNASRLSTLANILDDGTSGQVLTSQGSGGVAFADAAGGSSVTTVTNVSGASDSLTAISSPSVGDIVFVTSTNGLFIRKSNGWFKIADVTNLRPTGLTGVSNSALAIDGTPTTITLAATDPEGLTLTFSAAAKTGSNTTFSAALTDGNTVNALNGSTVIATVAQASNVFTIDPNTANNGGTVDITFSVTDGVNTALTADGQFTLTFVTTVTDSKYTTLLATATPKNTTLYRYFKFLPQTLRSSSDFQISEFELTDGSSYYSPTSAQQLYRSDDSDGDDYTAAQNVAASIDGNTSTKLYNGGWASKYYLYDMGSSFNTVLTGWRYVTGDDVDGRDPISWTLLGSTNNSDWVLLDQRVNETITTSRSTATQDFTFNATNQAFFNAANTNSPIAVNGDAHAGSFSPYRSGGYAMSLNGTDESFEPNHSSAGGLGTTWSVSYWAYIPSSGATNNYPFIFDFDRTNSSGNGFALQANLPVKNFNLTHGNLGAIINTATSLTCFDKWSYYVVTHSSGTTTLYIDGSSVGSSTASEMASVSAANVQQLVIGADRYSSSGFHTKMDVRDFHVRSAAHSGAVNNEPAVADSNTVILAAYKPYLAAQTGASTALEPIINNSVSTKPFSPYDYEEYSATDNGGSVYFDGTGDYLSISNQGISGNLTYEGWFYQTVAQSNTWRALLSSSTYASGTPFEVYTYNTNIELWTSGSGGAAIITAPFKAFTWFYVAVVRSSNIWTLYVNGKPAGSNTVNGTYNFASTTGWSVGAGQTGSYPFTGYASDVKLINSAITNFTPPTSPKSSSGASLHIKGTDASIIDKSQSANLKLFGDTTGSTDQVRSGVWANTKTMKFDGSGDYISTLSSPLLSMGTRDFTIECWVNKSVANHKGIWQISSTAGGLQSTNYGLTLALGFQVGRWQIYAGGNSAGINSSSFSLSTNTWYHTAVIRYNGTTRLFIDGTQIISTSDTYNYTGTYMVIGGYYSTSYLHQGYIQDLRITKGEARYIDKQNPTANFTPPSAPLEG
jgi:hypothetical protein